MSDPARPINRTVPYVGVSFPGFKPSAVAHQGASRSDPALATWTPPAGSADADLLPELNTLLPRSRDLGRNTPFFSGALQTLQDSVVGAGLRLSSKPDYRALGRDFEWAKDFSQRVEALWRSATNTPDIDAARVQKMGGLSGLIFRGVLESGGVIVLPMWDKAGRRGARFRTYFQVIEADRLSNPHGQPDSDRLRGGIEIDRDGAAIAYHIRKVHPGDAHLLGTALWPMYRRQPTAPGGVMLGTAQHLYYGEWERIPARTPWGRPRVVHIFDKQRIGQNRGKPLFAAIMKKAKMLDKYQQTEMQAAIVNALIAAFIKTALPEDALVELLGGEVDSNAVAAMDTLVAQRNQARAGLQAGAVIPLHPGEELQSFSPNRPAGNYQPFVDGLVSELAVGLNMSPTVLTKDFRRSNFSSARADLLETWRFFMGRRDFLSDNWCGVALQLLMEEWVNEGLLDIELDDFYLNRVAYCQASWLGPPRGHVDPVKEPAGAKIRLENGTTTLEAECAAEGTDYEEVMDQRKREADMLADRNLPAATPTQIVVHTGDEPAQKKG